MKTIKVAGGKIINVDNVAYTEEFILAAPGLLMEEAEQLGLIFEVTKIVFNTVGKDGERLTLELDGDQRTTFLEQWSAQ